MELSEQELAEAATTCDECTSWLEHCHAECCRDFSFAVGPTSDIEYSGDVVRVRALISTDARRYLELHGAQVEGDFITVPKAAVSATSKRLVVRMRCHALQDDDLCSLYDGRQPLACSEFTQQTALSGMWVVPKKCLFAYERHRLRPDKGES